MLGSCVTMAAAALLLSVTAGVAADIRLLSGNGAKGAVRALAEQFERTGAHRVAIHFEVNAALKRKIEAGEVFDAVVLNPPVLGDLIRQGKIAAATRTDIGRAGLGVGVRAGAARPDIGSVAAFKRTLLAASAVAYPGESASGIYFVGSIAWESPRR